MLPVCNWLSDHLLVLKGEVQMAQFLVCETGTFPTPSPPPQKKHARQAASQSPSPLPPKKAPTDMNFKGLYYKSSFS